MANIIKIANTCRVSNTVHNDHTFAVKFQPQPRRKKCLKYRDVWETKGGTSAHAEAGNMKQGLR